jgi:anti-anti-sigma factor
MSRPGSLVSDDGDHLDLTVTQVTERICVIGVGGELDMLTSPALQRVLAEEIQMGSQVVVIDLSGCGFIGSVALAVLAEAHGQAAAMSGPRFALAALNDPIDRALRISGLHPLFDIYPSLPDAVAALSDD